MSQKTKRDLSWIAAGLAYCAVCVSAGIGFSQALYFLLTR